MDGLQNILHKCIPKIPNSESHVKYFLQMKKRLGICLTAQKLKFIARPAIVGNDRSERE